MAWQKIETLPEKSDIDIRGLLWGRLYVRSDKQQWVTDWKVLKGTWVHWLGSRVNGSPRDSANWYVQDSPPARIERVEATHFMPLPKPPKQ